MTSWRKQFRRHYVAYKKTHSGDKTKKMPGGMAKTVRKTVKSEMFKRENKRIVTLRALPNFPKVNQEMVIGRIIAQVLVKTDKPYRHLCHKL